MKTFFTLFFKFLFFFISVIGLVAVAFLLLIPNDLPPFDDEVFHIAEVEGSPETSAWTQIKKLSESSDEIDQRLNQIALERKTANNILFPEEESYSPIWEYYANEMLDEKFPWDNIFVEAVLSEYASHINFIKTASSLNWTPDAFSSSSSKLLIYWTLIQLDFEQMLRKGETTKAINDWISILDTCSAIASDTTAIIYLAELHIDDSMRRTLQKMLKFGELNSNELKKLTMAVEIFFPKREALNNTIKRDIAFINTYSLQPTINIQEKRSEKKSKHIKGISLSVQETTFPFVTFDDSNLLQPYRMRRHLLDEYDYITKQEILPYDNFQNNFPEKKQLSFFQKLISGNFFIDSFSVMSPNNWIFAFPRKVALYQNIQVAIACENYRLKTGHLPSALNQLLPEFLETVPIDPFDGNSLRYDSDRAIIYSIGNRGEGNEAQNSYLVFQLAK